MRSSFLDFGISSSFDWSVTYDPIIGAIYTLMAVSLIMLIIPAVRALQILTMDTVNEEE